MAVQIDENILMAATALIFVPLFIFFIKLIIQMGTIQSKIETINEIVHEHKTAINELGEVLTEIRMVKMRLDHIEQQRQQQQGSNQHKGGPNIR